MLAGHALFFLNNMKRMGCPSARESSSCLVCGGLWIADVNYGLIWSPSAFCVWLVVDTILSVRSDASIVFVCAKRIICHGLCPLQVRTRKKTKKSLSSHECCVMRRFADAPDADLKHLILYGDSFPCFNKIKSSLLFFEIYFCCNLAERRSFAQKRVFSFLF